MAKTVQGAILKTEQCGGETGNIHRVGPQGQASLEDTQTLRGQNPDVNKRE